MDLLEELQSLSLGLVFLGVIFTIVAALFVIISILLIYSLLMVTVEEKSFEIGIYRMVGVNKIGLITMVMLKAFFFVLPAIIAGYLLSILILWLVYSLLFNAAMGVKMAPIPTFMATFYALIVGLIIPILSSLYPMRIVLSKTLTDALNYSTSKTKAVFVKIIQAKNFDKKPYIVFGVISVIYGLSIYYFLPLSLISLNFSLMLIIFFMILIGMFCGMVLLALNLQRILEITFVYVFLFYERTSTRMIVLKNMIAHKPRNRTTILIYAMSVGFLIMIIVSYNLEIINAAAIAQLEEGHYLYAQTSNSAGVPAAVPENLLAPYKDKIEYLAYETHDPEDSVLGLGYNNMIASDSLGLIEFETGFIGVTPFYEKTLMKQYLMVGAQNTSTSLDLIEQLYTPRGMQSVGLPAYIQERLGIHPNNFDETLRSTLYTSNWNVFTTQRCLWSTKLFPGKDMIERKNEYGYDTIVSVPTFRKLIGASSKNMMNFIFHRVAIKLKDIHSEKDTKDIRKALEENFVFRQNIIYDHISGSGNLNSAGLILDLIFNVIIGSVMFLCYFALSSSMTANMIEQKKEIGVLRAIGLKKTRIYFLYIYE
jgi:hypothetical protein